MNIHPTAIIEPGAELHDSVLVGPHSIIEADVRIGEGCVIESSVRIYGGTSMGRNNRVCHGVVLGCEPQDLGFEPAKSKPLVIGDDNHFKEGANVSRGVKTEAGTVIGNGNYFMGNFHVGHDCVIGDGNILAHGTALAGHVTIGSKVFISGLAGIHQFTHVGNLAMVSGLSRVVKDIPPFTTGDGNPARVCGINSIGLRRAGIPAATRSAIKQAYKTLYQSGMNLSQALEQLKQSEQIPEVGEIIRFFEQSERGVTAHR